MIDFFDVAKGIVSIHNEALKQGVEIGKAQAPISFAIRSVDSLTARKITDQDGHWDGDGTMQMIVTAVVSDHSPTLEYKTLRLACDLEIGKHMADEILKKLKEIEYV